MKVIIQDMKDLSDSRELMEASSPLIMRLTSVVILVLFIVALIWSYFGKIEDYTRVNGVVRPNEQVSVIKSIVTGKVQEVFFEEGTVVKQGDKLFTLDGAQMALEKESLGKQIEKAKQEISLLEKLKNSVQDNKNYFNASVKEEQEYYNKFVKYITDVRLSNLQNENAKLNTEQAMKEVNITEEALVRTIKDLKVQVADLSALKKSVQDGQNVFKEGSLFYKRYTDYAYSLMKLESALETAKQEYKKQKTLHTEGSISDEVLAQSKKAVDNVELELKIYKNQYMVSLDTEIQKVNTSLTDSKDQLEKLRVGIQYADKKKSEQQSVVEKYKYDYIVQIDDSISAHQSNINQLNTNLQAVNMQIEDTAIVAPIDGVVNVITEVNTGDVIQAGQEIVSIVPVNKEEYKIRLYVPNQDIAHLKVGQEVKYQFHALPYKEYGELSGTITKMSTDSSINRETGMSYYTVEASVKETEVQSYKGEKASIKIGMSCEAKVIKQSKRILYWFLQKIDIME